MNGTGYINRSVTSVALIVFFLHVVADEAGEKAALQQPAVATARPSVVSPGEDSSPVMAADAASVESAGAGNTSLSLSLPSPAGSAAIETDTTGSDLPEPIPQSAAVDRVDPISIPVAATPDNTGVESTVENDKTGETEQIQNTAESTASDLEPAGTDAVTPAAVTLPPAEPAASTPAAEAVTDDIAVESALLPGIAAMQEYEVPDRNLHILGATIAPGESRRLHWLAGETFYGDTLNTPIHIIHGDTPGRTLCLTAGIHGDELNGVEIVLSLMDSIGSRDLSGTIIGVPVVNLLGFTRGTRYLPDRRDLNRYFPGNPKGSSAARIAYSFFEEIIRHCDLLVDLHTGSLHRTNLPQLRADLDDPTVLEFTRHFGATAVLHSRNIRGNLRSAALRAGIPAVTFELGEPGSMQQEHIEYGIKAIETLLDKLDMRKRRLFWTEPQPVYYGSRWIRVNNGGLLRSAVKVGAKVKQGALLGTIVNPLTSDVTSILSPYNGRVLGMALNQFMLPGYAAFHIGIIADEKELFMEPPLQDCWDWENPNNLFTEEQDCAGEMLEENGGDDNSEEQPQYLPEDEPAEEMDLL